MLRPSAGGYETITGALTMAELIFLDLEWNTAFYRNHEGQRVSFHELIEVAAMKVDQDSGAMVDSFHSYDISINAAKQFIMFVKTKGNNIFDSAHYKIFYLPLSENR